MQTPKLKFVAVSVVMLAFVVVILWQQRHAERLAADFQQQAGQASTLQAENQRLAEQLRTVSERSQAESRELLRLRGQSGRMRQTEEENARLRNERDRLAKDRRVTATETNESSVPETAEASFRSAKLFFGRDLARALRMAADTNNGKVPTELRGPLFDMVESLSKGAEHGIRTKHFELVYQGSLDDVKDGADTVLAREREPMQSSDGRWVKIYVMADGSSRYIAADARDAFPARETQLWPGQFKP
ncbi:MAG: hypothetical protein NTW03_17975 [Verrucomicrobia bacterium]|nr:hypothetical protein [Verrucomicrobiota bacterium]